MIRMGRSSKTESQPQTGGAAEIYQAQPTSSTYQYGSEASGRQAMSDSDSMARDIREGRLSGFVGHGTVLTGETTFQAMLRVDGHLTGQVSSESGTLIIGSTGQVDANIVVAAAVINGTVNGDIVASEKLELGRTARVVGNIQTPRLLMEDGAILEGSCMMVKAREAVEKREAETSAPQVSEEFTPYEINGADEDRLNEFEESEETTEATAS